MFVFGIISIEVWNTQFPVWAFVLALVGLYSLDFFYRYWLLGCRLFRSYSPSPSVWFKLLPISKSVWSMPLFIQQYSIPYWHLIQFSVITELVIGYALPGRPIAMMMFKTWGYITMAQALTFSSDFKLGHYMKIPWVSFPNTLPHSPHHPTKCTSMSQTSWPGSVL